MKIEIEHPAFVVAIHKGGRTPKPTVLLTKSEFNLETVSSAEAPLAFRIHSERKNGISEARNIRLFAGRLYGEIEAHDPVGRKWPAPRTLDEIVEMAGRQHLKTGGILFRVLEKLRNEVLSHEAGGIHPSGIRNGLYGTSKPIEDDSPLVEACRAQLDSLVMDAEIEAQIERWRGITQHDLDKYLTVDGVAYQFCGEPIYKVGDDVRVYFPDAPDGGLLTFSYAAGDRSDAVATVYRLAEERASRTGGMPERNRCQVEIEVIDNEAVTWRAEEMDFDRYARSVEGNLHTALARLSDGHRHIRVPKSVFVAWLDLRDFLETYHPRDGVPEELEQKLSDALAEWIPFRTTTVRDVEYLYQPDEKLNDIMFARFAERPISLVSPAITSFRP